MALNQLQQIRNGYTRPMLHSIARQSNKQQSYIQHSQQSTGLPYAFQNMQINADLSVHQGAVMSHHKAGGSDSGSGSGGEISPPETPSNVSGMSGERREMGGNNNNNRRGMRGMNGRQQQQQQQQQGQGAASGIKSEQQGSVIFSTSSSLAGGQFASSGDQQQLLVSSNNVASSLINSNSQNNLQQLAGAMGNVTQSPTAAFVNASTATTFPPQAAYQLTTNRTLPGQLLYIQQPIQFIQQQQPPPPQPQHQVPTGTTITPNMRSSPSLQIPPPTLAASPQQQPQSTLTNSSAYPTNKMNQSCFNCGSTSHSGRECQEASMEDVTRNSIYKLDYNSSTGNATTTTATATTSSDTITPTNTNATGTTTPVTSTVPKIKPHFNTDIVPPSAIDQDEIIDLISDSSSNGSRK